MRLTCTTRLTVSQKRLCKRVAQPEFHTDDQGLRRIALRSWLRRKSCLGKNRSAVASFFSYNLGSLLPGDVAIFAAKEDQRFPALNLDVFHFPNNNGVIPGHVRRHDTAAQLRNRVF